MRWRDLRRSDNVEDRRGMRMRPAAGIAGGGGVIVLIVIVVSVLMGKDPRQLLIALGGDTDVPGIETGQDVPQAPPAGHDEDSDFVSAVLGSTEDMWTEMFASGGSRYVPPRLVLFRDAVESACGLTSSAAGPFYCPSDRRVYLDLGFFQELRTRFGASGEFARAYVIAHEIGHHVQNLVGISNQVDGMRARMSEGEANALSVRVELQADCLAGVWGNHAGKLQSLLEAGDAEEGLRAAAAIGDDLMQKRAQGYVSPESWTHGSSRQRVEWLQRGLREGTIEACDTLER